MARKNLLTGGTPTALCSAALAISPAGCIAQDAKDSIFLLENPLHATCGKHKKALKFAKMEQAHHGIDVRVRQEYTPNWRWGGIIRGRSEFVGGEHLLTQIRRSA